MPLFHLLFQLMIFSALLESGASSVHAINERIAQALLNRRGVVLSNRARLAIALALLVGCMFVADRFGLVALIANGYRALAYILIAVYVVPVLTIGLWRLGNAARTTGGRMKIARLPSLIARRGCRALAAPPADFDATGRATCARAYGAPGMAIAIVEDGKPTLASGCGVRRARHARRRSAADTIFGTGSTGKAFTVAALATLVDAGKLSWDDKVIDHLPGFQMYDPWVTREMTVRDLLVHRSGLGLGAGDLLFVPRSDLSREETVSGCASSSPRPAFAAAMPTTTSSTWSPAS